MNGSKDDTELKQIDHTDDHDNNKYSFLLPTMEGSKIIMTLQAYLSLLRSRNPKKKLGSAKSAWRDYLVHGLFLYRFLNPKLNLCLMLKVVEFVLPRLLF